jgi:drug/metabolite transporter (DMT)-like permease
MSLLARISPHDDERSARLAGIALMLLSVFMFSFGDALGKFIVASYSVGQLLCFRACAALAVLAPMIWRHRAEFLSLERPWLQLLRVVLSTLEVAAFFLAVVYLPLADVITYYLAGPIFVTAMSALLLREKVGWRRWCAIVVGFCGVLIALRPSSQTFSWPALIALGGSLSFATLMLITRSLRATPDIAARAATIGRADSGQKPQTMGLPVNPRLAAAPFHRARMRARVAPCGAWPSRGCRETAARPDGRHKISRLRALR